MKEARFGERECDERYLLVGQRAWAAVLVKVGAQFQEANSAQAWAVWLLEEGVLVGASLRSLHEEQKNQVALEYAAGAGYGVPWAGVGGLY